nr:MAG TPA: hypothetical protein [Caudoviricetes sp.]
MHCRKQNCLKSLLSILTPMHFSISVNLNMSYTLLNMISCADLLCQLFRIRSDN